MNNITARHSACMRTDDSILLSAFLLGREGITESDSAEGGSSITDATCWFESAQKTKIDDTLRSSECDGPRSNPNQQYNSNC